MFQKGDIVVFVSESPLSGIRYGYKGQTAIVVETTGPKVRLLSPREGQTPGSEFTPSKDRIKKI
jgi:hypothetical protein